jgi:hypothetical protein
VLAAVAFAVLSASALIAFTPGVASATCPGEENIFWTDKPSGTLRTNAYGTKNQLTVTSRTINVTALTHTRALKVP